MEITVFGAQETRSVSADRLPDLLAEKKEVWIDMVGPSEEGLHIMRDVLQFHPLAIPDRSDADNTPRAGTGPGRGSDLSGAEIR